MGAYKFLVQSSKISLPQYSGSLFMHRASTPRLSTHLHKIIKTPSIPQSRNMSLFFPRVAFSPARCAPVVARADFAPLFSLFDDSLNELHRSGRELRKSFNPHFDVKEAKEAYTVDAELPGIDPKDVSIEFTDEHTLTIKGRTERHSESGSRPTDAVEAKENQEAPATPAAEGESSATKSHQPTVEDEEAPANSSAAAAESSEVAAPAPKETAKAEPQQKYWISERRVGEFTRSFSFPARVDQEAVKASLKNGVLSIVVPKAAAPESRRIEIE